MFLYFELWWVIIFIRAKLNKCDTYNYIQPICCFTIHADIQYHCHAFCT
jgi:hypothetical protein